MKRESLIWLAVLAAAVIYGIFRMSTGGMGLAYQTEVDRQTIPSNAWEAMAGGAQSSLRFTIGVWVAALLTLFVLSFAYRDNALYKISESLFVGISAAYGMVVGFWTTVVPNLFGKLFPEQICNTLMPGLSTEREPGWWLYFVPLVLGAMLLWRLAPKGNWIARWPLAFIIGTTAGIRLIGFIQADFLSQIRNSILPLAVIADDGSFEFWKSFDNVILLIGVMTCLVYFFFSFEHKGVVGKTARVGIWFLMVTFGAAFGYTVMGRIALLAIRLEFLFDDWLWWIDPTGKRVPDLAAMLWSYLPAMGLG